MKIINTSRCGQSIAELLLALAIGAIFMVATMTVVIPALRENGQTENIQQSATIAQDLLGNVRVWSESGWNNITALATGTTHQYYLITSSSPYMATSGIQSIVVGTTTYIRSFYLSDVYRTSGGGIASSPDGNTYDPSTKQVSVVYDWAHGVTSTMSAYLTRNGDAVTDQTDWSGGPNPESIATSAGSQFASSSNINYSSTVGSIFVFGDSVGFSSTSSTSTPTEQSGWIYLDTPITITESTTTSLSFSGTEGEVVSLTASGMTYSGECSPDFSVQDPADETLTHGSGCGNGVELSDITLPSDGTYTVLVTSGAQTYSATLTLANAFITGTIAFNTTTTISNTFPGQTTNLTFTGDAGQVVSLNSGNNTYPCWSTDSVGIEDANGNVLSSGWVGPCWGGSVVVSNYTLPSAGSYSVFLKASIATGSVDVNLETFTDITGTIAFNTTTTISNTFPGQTTNLTFTGDAGQVVSLNSGNNTYPCWSTDSVGIEDANGNVLSSGWVGPCWGGSKIVVGYTLPSTGSYSVFIKPTSDTGSVDVNLEEFSNITGTIPLGTTTTISNTFLGQTTNLTFTGDAGQVVSLKTSNNTYPCSGTNLYLEDTNGDTLASSGNPCGNPIITGGYTLPSAGTYHIFLNPGDNTGSMGVTLQTVDTSLELFAQWSLDEGSGSTVIDSSVNGNTGTWNGTPSGNGGTYYVGGDQQTYAGSFNGSDDYIQLPSGVYFNGGSFTISAWVYPTAFNSWSRVIDFGNGPNTDNVLLAITNGTSGMPDLGIHTPYSSNDFEANASIPLDQWSFVAATFDSGTTHATIYIDGNDAGDTTFGFGPDDVTRTDDYIGRSNWSSDGYAQGSIDDVSIYNYALSAAQVQALQTAGD